MKKGKALLALGLSLICMLTPISASAKEVTFPKDLIKTFDYKQYALLYPDLYAAYGFNANALLAHYETIGYKEGRVVNGLPTSVQADVWIYRKAMDILANHKDFSTEEKVKYVHDWIINQASIDQTVNANSYPDILFNHAGTSEAYAQCFQQFMDYMGIPCVTRCGMMAVTYGAPTWSWNVVNVDGKVLNIDCAADDPVVAGGLENVCVYTYYLQSDETFRMDHRW